MYVSHQMQILSTEQWRFMDDNPSQMNLYFYENFICCRSTYPDQFWWDADLKSLNRNRLKQNIRVEQLQHQISTRSLQEVLGKSNDSQIAQIICLWKALEVYYKSLEDIKS